MENAVQCNAVERGLRCTLTPPAGSKWCRRHEELQAKSLKTYKRFSFELEAYEECQINLSCIKLCDCSDELGEWSACLRKKWILTQRTVDARIKHHKQFYVGGDVSHQAFIDGLNKQKVILEEKLLRIDERAYELFKQNEKAGWLDQHLPVDPICEEPAPAPEPKLSSTIDFSPSGGSEPFSDDAGSSGVEDAAEEVFSETASSASSDSCASACCTKVLDAPPNYESRILAYLNYPACFIDAEDSLFASKYIDNLFRYAISRIPSLLVRARSADCPSLICFLSEDNLQEGEYARLWRGLKYNNVHPEGKLTVGAIRNALWDAEHEDKARKGACIELLGGKVWKDAMIGDLSRRAWDHFYRFTSCSGCALSITHSFESWATNRLLAQPESRYPTWFDDQDSPAERQLRACGAVLCGSYRKGRSGCMEHVKPKKKGMRSVWIERDFRNWCFIRMVLTPANEEKISKMGSSNLTTCVWPRHHLATSKPDGITWVSRLRSGYNASDRRSARWTTESTFHYTDKTHERLLSTSPETYYHNGKPFSDPTLDVLVIDSGPEQNFEVFLAAIADKLASIADDEERVRSCLSTSEPERPLLDRALFLGRHMFREVA